MMTLPAPLSNFMQGQKLDGLKPFALLYRNKWDSENNKFALEETPIDISDLIAKPNTLSMTLDVNEVAQYNANNVTLTLSDTKNYFVEGTPNSYFPEGYQIYGSRIVLYYGLDGVNRTPLFTGVIKELPTHKPENYQVDVKLVSPLEMLKDIEAKDFSDKVTGETLTYVSTDSDGHRVYRTSGTGVGGFNGVYANGNKLYEGVDYEIDDTNTLGIPATLTIINEDYYTATITADYYTWKTGLTAEQVITGLVALGGYENGRTKISNILWNTSIRSPYILASVWKTVGYYMSSQNYYTWSGHSGSQWNRALGSSTRRSELPTNFDFNFFLHGGHGKEYRGNALLSVLDQTQQNGIVIRFGRQYVPLAFRIQIYRRQNGSDVLLTDYPATTRSSGEDANDWFSIQKRGTTIQVYSAGILRATITGDNTVYAIDRVDVTSKFDSFYFQNDTWVFYDTQRNLTFNLNHNCIITNSMYRAGSDGVWGDVQADRNNENTYFLQQYFSNDNTSNWEGPISYDMGVASGNNKHYMCFVLGPVGGGFDIQAPRVWYTANTLVLALVNLSGLTVLEALQDFSLITGYEFGVSRDGVFFFQPRIDSTQPVYVLDHSEIVKVDTVKKNLSNFFTKLTLTFAQVPLEFYANSGPRPTPIDKYGVINKDIDKPDIVNYDNPELAQAIGPQLLEVYSAMPNIIQVTGKLNLALELGDVVSLRRNINLITPEAYTDYSKYEDLDTYYRACKITGMNYNFSKKQITYTLRDVSNKNTEPQYEFNEYIYDFAVPFGVKE